MAGEGTKKDPRQDVLESYSRVEADRLRARLPKGMGFALILFDFGHKQFLSYAANANRQDMIATLRELIGHLESQERSS